MTLDCSSSSKLYFSMNDNRNKMFWHFRDLEHMLSQENGRKNSSVKPAPPGLRSATCQNFKIGLRRIFYCPPTRHGVPYPVLFFPHPQLPFLTCSFLPLSDFYLVPKFWLLAICHTDLISSILHRKFSQTHCVTLLLFFLTETQPGSYSWAASSLLDALINECPLYYTSQMWIPDSKLAYQWAICTSPYFVHCIIYFVLLILLVSVLLLKQL